MLNSYISRHCTHSVVMAIYFNLVRNMGLKKPEPELWTLTVCNKSRLKYMYRRSMQSIHDT